MVSAEIVFKVKNVWRFHSKGKKFIFVLWRQFFKPLHWHDEEPRKITPACRFCLEITFYSLFRYKKIYNIIIIHKALKLATFLFQVKVYYYIKFSGIPSSSKSMKTLSASGDIIFIHKYVINFIQSFLINQLAVFSREYWNNSAWFTIDVNKQPTVSLCSEIQTF